MIDENGLILAGNGLAEAMRAEGFKKVWAVSVTGLSENDKKKFMLADNKTAGLGIDDLANIEALINDLAGDFDIPGFDDEILNSINAASEEISQALDDYGKATEENIREIEARAGANGEEPEGDEPETGSGPDTAAAPEGEQKSVTCPKCGEVIWL